MIIIGTPWLLILMEYILEEQVGLGTFGKVFRGRHKTTHHLVALKRVKMETEREGFPVTAVREAKLLESMSHESIIKLERIIKTEESIEEQEENGQSGVFFVFPYYQYDLVGLMRKLKLTLDDSRFILFHILQGLAYLHSLRIVHRDVKPSNILISHDSQVCLGDFGLAKSLLTPDYHSLRPLTNRVVTLWYRAPELLLGATKYDEAVDIWAAGCVLYEMILGDGVALFFGNDEFTVLDAITKKIGPIPTTLQHLPWLSGFNQTSTTTVGLDNLFAEFNVDAKDLLLKMLILDPSARITAAQALRHPFFDQHKHIIKQHQIAGLTKDDSQHEFEVKKN